MASRIPVLRCDVAIRTCYVARFASIHIPPSRGCSHYTLFEAASAIDTAITTNHNEAIISRRLRTILQAAIDYHFDLTDAASGSGSARQRAMVSRFLAGEPLFRAALDAARAADANNTDS